MLIYTIIEAFNITIWANLETLFYHPAPPYHHRHQCSGLLPDGRAPGEPHGVGGHPLAPQVERDVLRLHLDCHPLAETTQGVISGPGSHRHGVLEGNIRVKWLYPGVLGGKSNTLPLSEVKTEYCCRTPQGNIEYSAMMRRQRLSLHWQHSNIKQALTSFSSVTTDLSPARE